MTDTKKDLAIALACMRSDMKGLAARCAAEAKHDPRAHEWWHVTEATMAFIEKQQRRLA